MELNNKLKNIPSYPFHMPGHKRNSKFNISSSDIDITEIDGFDNLHNPNDCLMRLENKLSKLYNSKKSIISVNGSTCGILSAISGVCKPNDKIIIARNCHKSVYNACYINRLKIEYIMPSIHEEFGCFNAITQDQIDTAIKENPDAKAVVITTPTYEGIISKIKSSIPLIIDAAHGAHFGFNDNFPAYPTADIVISSLHKTLPALTQTAVVNIYNEKYSQSVKKYMDIFETSSPSYVLMNSIDICSDFLENCRNSYDDLYNNCKLLINKIKYELSIFKIIPNDDISRLCLSCNKLNGNEFANLLRKKYNIEVEMSCEKYVIFIITVGDDSQAFKMLYRVLCSIEKDLKNNPNIEYNNNYKIELPTKAIEQYEIDETKIVDLDNAKGMISGEFVYAYPPGIPIIIPGEIINNDIIKYIESCISTNTNIISENGILNHKILTKC